MKTTAAEVLDHVRHWPTWQRDLWLGTVAAGVVFVAAFYALHNLTAFAVFVGGLLWLAGVVGGLVAVVGWRDAVAERDAMRAQAELLADELSHADRAIRSLAAEAAEAPMPYVVTNVIPMQRAHDSWLEAVMAEQEQTWNERHGDDDLTALIRATEE